MQTRRAASETPTVEEAEEKSMRLGAQQTILSKEKGMARASTALG